LQHRRRHRSSSHGRARSRTQPAVRHSQGKHLDVASLHLQVHVLCVAVAHQPRHSATIKIRRSEVSGTLSELSVYQPSVDSVDASPGTAICPAPSLPAAAAAANSPAASFSRNVLSSDCSARSSASNVPTISSTAAEPTAPGRASSTRTRSSAASRASLATASTHSHAFTESRNHGIAQGGGGDAEHSVASTSTSTCTRAACRRCVKHKKIAERQAGHAQACNERM
jgi:hypothetical protein